MAKKEYKLARLDDAKVSDDGEAVAFTIKTIITKELRVYCPLAELGDIFSFLGHLAIAAGKVRTVPAPLTSQGQNYLAPVPAQGIGFQAGADPDETLLLVRLSGFDMAFAVPSSGLAALADDIQRIALTLSAGGGRPQ